MTSQTHTMSIRLKDQYVFLAMWVMFIVCMGVSIILLMDPNLPSYYTLLPLLTFSFGVIPFIYPVLIKQMFHNLGVAMIVGGYFMRNVVTPLVMRFGEYSGAFKLNLETNMPKAIILMIYETYVVLGCVLLYLKYTHHKSENCKVKELYLNPSTSIKKISMLLLLISAFCVGVLIMIPSVKTSFTTIFDSDLASMVGDTDSIAVRGGIKRALVTLFQMCVGFLRYLVPNYFIMAIRKRMGESYRGILLSTVFIGVQFMVIAETLANSLFGAMVSMVLLIKLYPSKRKTLFVGCGICGGILIGYFVFMKTMMVATDEKVSLADLSEILQAYFPGVCNMAGVFNIENPDKGRTLFFDFYYAIPFRGSLFGLEEERLVQLYNVCNRITSNIIPAAGHAYHYLGPILAPSEPAIMACLGSKYAIKLGEQEDIWRYIVYVYLVIILSISPVMYNISNTLAFMTLTFIPMYIISRFSNESRSNNERGKRRGETSVAVAKKE